MNDSAKAIQHGVENRVFQVRMIRVNDRSLLTKEALCEVVVFPHRVDGDKT